MSYDPNTFPVAETRENVAKYIVGAIVRIPSGTTCQFEFGRVVDINYGKPGGIMNVTVRKAE